MEILGLTILAVASFPIVVAGTVVGTVVGTAVAVTALPVVAVVALVI